MSSDIGTDRVYLFRVGRNSPKELMASLLGLHPTVRNPYALAPAVSCAIVFLPMAFLLGYSVLLLRSDTHVAALVWLQEGGPIEVWTFWCLLIGGLWGLWFVWRARRQREPRWVTGYYTVSSFGLMAIAMEEVSWGQRFFGFETPESLRVINTQEETTLHNLIYFNDHLEIFPLAFGICGLLGIGFRLLHYLQKVSPPLVLWSWFLIVTLLSAVDLTQDFYIIDSRLDDLMNQLDEAVEMCVGIAGSLYIWLNARRFALVWRN